MGGLPPVWCVMSVPTQCLCLYTYPCIEWENPASAKATIQTPTGLNGARMSSYMWILGGVAWIDKHVNFSLADSFWGLCPNPGRTPAGGRLGGCCVWVPLYWICEASCSLTWLTFSGTLPGHRHALSLSSLCRSWTSIFISSVKSQSRR